MGKFANKGRCQNQTKAADKMSENLDTLDARIGYHSQLLQKSQGHKYVSAIDPNMTGKDCHSKLLKTTEIIMDLRASRNLDSGPPPLSSLIKLLRWHAIPDGHR